MNRYYLLFIPWLLLACTSISNAQNHVPNAGFEDHTGCPTGAMEAYRCHQWEPVVGTPDYYHTCGTGDAGIPHHGYLPNGFLGYQVPAEGSAYMGFLAHNPNHFEYIKVPIQPLTPGQLYEVSMSVNLANFSSLASDNIGVFFYDKGYQSIPWTITTLFMEMLPQVHYRNFGIIRDTANWVRLTKQYIPDSAYSHIMIGGFNDSTSTYSMDTVGTFLSYGTAYYLIDSVVIRPIYPASTNDLGTIKSLNLYPNPNNGRFSLRGNLETKETLNIDVLNTLGQVVYSRTIVPSEGMLHNEIQLEDVAKGIYILRVANASGNIYTTRFLLE